MMIESDEPASTAGVGIEVGGGGRLTQKQEGFQCKNNNNY